jgi:hypothetical protein
MHKSNKSVSIVVTTELPLRQAGISKVFQEAERPELDKIRAKFFYKVIIPFIISKNKGFREAVRRTVDFC